MKVASQHDDGTAHLASDGDADVRRINTGWRALFSFTKKAHLITLLPALFLSTAAGILQPSLAVFFGRFFNAFSDYGGGKIDGTHLMNQTLTNVYALVGLGAATWLLKGGYFASWLCVGELHAQSVRDELFKCLLLRDLNWYETRTSGVGALLSRLQTQIRELQMGTSQPLGFAVNYSIQCVVSLGLAFFYSWRLTLVTLAAVPVCAIILSMISSKIQPNALAQELEITKASKLANNAISNITAIKCSNTQEYEGRRYTSAVSRAAVFYGKQALANSLQIGFARFAATSLFVPGLWYGQHLVNDGTSTAGKVVTTFWSCLVATKSFEDLLPHVLVLEKGRAAAVALRELLDRVARGQEISERTEGLFPEHCEGDVEFRDIFFEYPSRPGRQVLKGTTFFFPAGETSFVVGRSGSGKSTVGNLLMRFYQPTTGTVIIDGDHIRDLSMSWIRNNITLVQQQSILFNETILRNITFGHRDYDLLSHDHVEPALTVAGLQATIAELPKGLDNMVGMSGATLSGGQKQRIAIARSRLRDTPILILDESTSALSMDARTKIMANIRRWRQNKTTIIITHDLTQIKDDDFVYILDEGQIVAEGFRSAVAAHLENGSFKTDIKTPKNARNDQLDVSWGSRVTSEESDGDLKASPVRKMVHQRKDSIDIHLEGILRSEKGLHVFSHQSASRLSRALSRRLPGEARMVLHPMSKRPAIGERRQIPNAEEPQLRSETLCSGITRVRLGRPMSLHQAMVMRSIYRQPSLGPKTLPSPTVFKTPELFRRISLHTPAADVQTKKAPSIQMILATVWPQLDRNNRIFLVCGIFATLVHASQTPILAYLLVRLFSTFYIKQDQARKALIYSAAVFSVAVLDGVAAFLMHYLLERSAETWVDNLRSEAFYRIMAQDKAWFDNPQNSASTLLSDLDRNAEEMRNLVGRFAAVIMVVVTMMTIGVFWALATCWKLTLVALATAPAMYFLTKGFEIVSSRWESRTNSAGEEIGAVFVETFSDIRTVRAFTLESYFHKKYTVASSKAITVGVRRAIYSGFFFGLSDSAINFIVALIFFVGAFLAKTNAYSVTSILNALCLLLFTAANANSVVAYIPQISSSADTAARLLRLAQLPLRTHEKDGRLKLSPAGPTTLSGPIHFVHMTFAYPSRPSPPALHNLNLTIPAGLCTAIVGASGSGKSTIASLLLGLYPPIADQAARSVSDPANGPPSLTLSGRDIRGLHLPTLRSLIAYVPQSPVIFPGSVRENITYGLNLNSPLTMQGNIEEAATRAGIHDFILTLPNGYSSVIGDGGLGLSGGQAQRVVIARALLRKPRLLILDEATSALDGESASIIRKSVLDLLEEAKRERALEKDGATTGRVLTVVIITHAQEMMAFADNVVVLEAGRVVEEGKFEELLSRGGKLWEMLRDGMEE